MVRCGFVLAALWALAGSVQAQEMRCNQVFMNPSEKAVCASPELLAIDAQMASAYQEAKPYLKGLRKDQRAFKRERKACKGDISCLLAVYEAQIAELRSAVPVPEPLPSSQAMDQPSPPSAPPLPGVLADVTAGEPAPTGPGEPVQPSFTPEPSVDQAPIERAKENPSSGTSWLLIGGLILGALIAIAAFFDWLFNAVGRCPQCTKWWVAEETGREEQMGTEYETVTRVDERRDRRGVLVDSVRRKEQIAHSVVRAAVRKKCRNCGHVWMRHEKRRV